MYVFRIEIPLGAEGMRTMGEVASVVREMADEIAWSNGMGEVTRGGAVVASFSTSMRSNGGMRSVGEILDHSTFRTRSKPESEWWKDAVPEKKCRRCGKVLCVEEARHGGDLCGCCDDFLTGLRQDTQGERVVR